MDFARKQLEKYGWSDGKGLGKHENGITEPLKPKIKRSVTGVGHDPASEFNEHWWSALYDKASKNVEVEEKNGKTKKIKTKDSDNFIITSSTWKMNKKSPSTDETEYSEYFVRTAVLTNDKGGRKTENVKSESEDEVEQKDVFKMTDEELFAACEGRTAHKGARHGLRAIGKLARIAEQEKNLLTQPEYQGYTHAKQLKQKVEQINLEDIVSNVHKKKKKRKHCNKSTEMAETCSLSDNHKLAESDSTLPIKLKRKNRDLCENYEDVQKNKKKKGKNDKNKEVDLDSSVQETVECEKEVSVDLNTNEDGTVKKPKKRRVDDMQTDSVSVNYDGLECKIKKKKKKSKNH